MKKCFIALAMIAVIGCVNKKDYQVEIKSTLENPPDSILSISDQGLQIKVSWKFPKPNQGSATLFDGASNPIWNTTYPVAMDDGVQASENEHLINYSFKDNDKTGTWKLVMIFDGEEIVNHAFEIAPARPDPNVYASVDCFAQDGRVNLSNFYQQSAEEQKNYALPENLYFDLIPAVRYQLHKRAAVCLAPELNYENIQNWESHFEKLSGMKVRQPKPTVHERIAEVMPVYEEEFLFVNKDFVRWFGKNMVPAPKDHQMNGVVYQSFYDIVLREKVRNLALIGLYSRSLPNEGLDIQVDYARIAATRHVEDERVILRDNYVDVMGYLTEQFEIHCNEWLAENIIKGEADASFSPIDMGFWLRRGIDGTADDVWIVLCNVLSDYDKDWYKTFIAPNVAP